jgi:rod shape determining protein RodA
VRFRAPLLIKELKRFLSNENQSIKKNLDWTCILIYSALVIMGWLNIYSSSLSSIEDTYQKQFVFILLTIPLIFIILLLLNFMKKYKISFCCFLVIISWSFLFGKTIAGQRCWYALGSLQYSPLNLLAATSLALRFLSDSQINLKVTRQAFTVYFFTRTPYSSSQW